MNSKSCSKCKELLPLESFHNKTGAKDGKQSSCKKCAIERVRKWQDENPERFEENWRKNSYGELARLKKRARLYGLSVEELKSMLEASNGLCEICFRKPPRWLVVDHCHDTLKVRGLLCEKCNQGLGLFADNIEFMKNAIKYLEKQAGSA